ncbi:MFS transporter [Stackebrandtia soli]|uniref:MFS transporter n=1 Tax=Stackebrandtia soli TaxID=1892856 RepID=UPI0039EAACDB
MSTVDSVPDSARSAVPADPRRWVGLAVLCASLLIVVMDMTILNVAIPAIDADLHPSSVELLWIVDVYSLVVAGFLVVAGGLADRFGRRRMLIIGYVAFGAIPLLVIVADSPVALIALRALLGLGGALIMPSTMSMIRNLFTDARERAVALGIWGAMAAVGAGVGPIVGGALLEVFTWHAAFLFNTPVMIVAIVASLLFLPESYGAKVRWDALGVVLSIVGMAGVVYAIKAFGKYGIADPTALTATVIGVGCLVWFARRCLNRPEPLLDIRLLRSRELTAGLLCALVTSVAIAAMMLLIAQWMQLVEGYTPLEAGLHLLPSAIVSGILSPLAPRIADWIGARTVMAGGLFVGGLGFALLYVIPRPWTYPPVAIALVLVGAGMASLAIGSAVIMSSAPAERAGNAAVMEETSFEVGNTLGVAVLGSIAAVMFARLVAPIDLDALGVSRADAEAARESIGGAITVADDLGPAGAELADAARAAFTDALATVGLVGAALMIATAVIVWWMTPRGMSVEGH